MTFDDSAKAEQLDSVDCGGHGDLVRRYLHIGGDHLDDDWQSAGFVSLEGAVTVQKRQGPGGDNTYTRVRCIFFKQSSPPTKKKGKTKTKLYGAPTVEVKLESK